MSASDAPPPEDVVFGNTVDALFLKALGTKLSMRCVERVKEAGIDLRSKLKLLLGNAFMDGFERTLIGKAMITAVRFMGPKRTLAKMTTNFRSSNNCMQTELREE